MKPSHHAAIIAAVTFLVSCGPSTPTTTVVADKPSAGSDIFTSDSLAKASLPASCEGGGIATGDELAVKDEVVLRSGPSKSAAKVINEKLSRAIGGEQPVTLDQTEKLKELCRQAEWSKIQVVEPDWLTWQTGWVPVSSLRTIARDTSGKRQYVEADFYWDDDTKPYKAQLVAGVNRVIRENSRCQSVDTGTLSLSGNRGTKANPVFFITCDYNGTPFNVWFSPEQATDKGHSFAAARNISQGDALVACQDAAKAAATNPQTVNFSVFMDVAFVPYPNGNSRLLSTFSAKNSFGVESKFRIQCFFEGASLTERSIEPTAS